MADDMQFVDGLLVKAPHKKAPDFVKASISIKVADLGLWLREKHKAGEEWVNIDVKEAKSGKWYAAVSTFKPKNGGREHSGDDTGQRHTKPAYKGDDSDDIPF